MVIGYHVIISAYGFWLPNDPRGSWSDFVGAWELVQFGRATKTDSRRSVAAKSHDRAARLEAKQSLKYPCVRYSGLQARAVGRGFAAFVAKSRLVVWACSILPDHVHLVTARHRYKVEEVAKHLKGAATARLTEENLHPLSDMRTGGGRTPSPWAEGQWAVFLDSDDDLRRAIRYVEGNPPKEGLPRQRWSFVTPFRGWSPDENTRSSSIRG
jgi:REP element-mobilizing transposase RayT